MKNYIEDRYLSGLTVRVVSHCNETGLTYVHERTTHCNVEHNATR